MRHDPYTLLVALDKSGKAKGTLYIDDGISYDYKTSKKMLYIQFSYDNGKLTGHQLVSPTYETRSWLEKVVIVGLDKAPASAHASLNTPTAEEQDLATQYDAKKKTLVIRKPGVNMADEWQIDLS
jgi:alpha 1,3-glucosidase